jgi:hypothetical protein
MIDTLQLQSLLAVFMPLVVDAVTTKVEDSRIRYIISTGISLLIGIILNINLFFPFDPQKLVANIGIVIVAAQASYVLYWKQSQARKTLDLAPPDQTPPQN